MPAQEDWTLWLQAQHRRAITLILIFMALLGLLGLGQSFITLLQGNSVNFLVYLAAYLTILALIFLSMRNSIKLISWGLMLLVFCFGLYSFQIGWLASGGRLFLVVTVVLAALFSTPRSALYVAGLAMLAYALFAVAYGTGLLAEPRLPSPTTFTPMFIEGVGFSITLTIVSVSLWYFGQGLKAASHANRQAQKSSASFHSIVERSSDGMMVIDQEGRVRFVNQAAEQFFNRSREGWLGQPSWLALQPGQSVELPILRPPAPGQPAAGLPAAGIGELRLVETEWEDQPAYLAILRDITERKQAEERIHAAHLDLQTAYEKTIEGWVRALDYRDHETEGHTQRVTELAVRLAQALGFGEEEVIYIRRGALLHDIGKIGVSDTILNKPGPLDDHEWAIMRRHPVLAREMLAPIDYFSRSIIIPYYHHEHWDGSGYPCGLAGEQIPLEARLFSIVDVWDALSSDRPYRRKLAHEEVIAYLSEQSGKLFDPRIVAVFLEVI